MCCILELVFATVRRSDEEEVSSSKQSPNKPLNKAFEPQGICGDPEAGDLHHAPRELHLIHGRAPSALGVGLREQRVYWSTLLPIAFAISTLMDLCGRVAVTRTGLHFVAWGSSGREGRQSSSKASCESSGS